MVVPITNLAQHITVISYKWTAVHPFPIKKTANRVNEACREAMQRMSVKVGHTLEDDEVEFQAKSGEPGATVKQDLEGVHAVGQVDFRLVLIKDSKVTEDFIMASLTGF